MSLAQQVLVTTRGWAAHSSNGRVRLAARNDQLEQEIALLREDLRIKDARLAKIPAPQRPHYQPSERLAILELRAARGWSLAQTARMFHVTPTTIASWMNRLDEEGPAALLRVREPVNKFPDFVRYSVQRLQTLCPRLGKVKIAQMLARAGLHLGVTTIGRMRRQPPAPAPRPRVETMPSAKRVTAKYPNHVWQCFLGRLIGALGTAPKYLVSDHGVQFTAQPFKDWCQRHDIQQRFGAVGKRGSIAVIERFWRTLKDGCSRVLPVVPLLRRQFQREIALFLSWYNERPHMTLKGATPDEVYFGRRPACRSPRFEPRPGWPRAAPCARPPVLLKGQAGADLDFNVKFVAGRRHLPRLTVTRAA
jgi:transposase InsO family protein